MTDPTMSQFLFAELLKQAGAHLNGCRESHSVWSDKFIKFWDSLDTLIP
jgi:hypothetical protein